MAFWKSFLLLPCFLGKHAKNNVFEDKWFLSKMFYPIGGGGGGESGPASNWGTRGGVGVGRGGGGQVRSGMLGQGVGWGLDVGRGGGAWLVARLG